MLENRTLEEMEIDPKLMAEIQEIAEPIFRERGLQTLEASDIRIIAGLVEKMSISDAAEQRAQAKKNITPKEEGILVEGESGIIAGTAKNRDEIAGLRTEMRENSDRPNT